MQDRIRVWVIRRGKRPFFEAEWRDPLTGKVRRKTTGTNIQRTAERFAAKLEKELQEGTYSGSHRTTWAHFRERYESEIVPSLADKTGKKVRAVFNAIENHVGPKYLAGLNAEQIGRLQERMRADGLTEPSIKSNLGHLKAALRWARRRKMLHEVPEIEMPKRTETMRGRAVTREELERMLAAVPKVVTPEPKLRKNGRPTAGVKPLSPEERQQRAERDARIVASWQRFIEGLYLSGLRLGEALQLSWDDETRILLQLDRRRPMMQIPPKRQKAHRYDLTPIVPEFAAFLQQTPQAERRRFVFHPQTRQPTRRGRLTEQQVIRVIAQIGRKANVVVHSSPVRYATAHDLRRSFCERWSTRVMPQVLMRLARHASIQTTMHYYAGHNAELTADAVWDAVSTTSSTNRPNCADATAQKKAETTTG